MVMNERLAQYYSISGFVPSFSRFQTPLFAPESFCVASSPLPIFCIHSQSISIASFLIRPSLSAQPQCIYYYMLPAASDFTGHKFMLLFATQQRCPANKVVVLKRMPCFIVA